MALSFLAFGLSSTLCLPWLRTWTSLMHLQDSKKSAMRLVGSPGGKTLQSQFGAHQVPYIDPTSFNPVIFMIYLY